MATGFLSQPDSLQHHACPLHTHLSTSSTVTLNNGDNIQYISSSSVVEQELLLTVHTHMHRTLSSINLSTVRPSVRVGYTLSTNF